MEVNYERDGKDEQLVDLFARTFTESEGAKEGGLIGGLVSNLLSRTPMEDIRVFTALDDGEIVGAAVFTRLVYASDPRSVFLLSPMAVAPDRQGKGVGQALLNQALFMLRHDGVDVAITYGDPAFYGKVGFLPLDETTAAPPLALSFPAGWIGQTLTDFPLQPLEGACTCVAALDDPAFW